MRPLPLPILQLPVLAHNRSGKAPSCGHSLKSGGDLKLPSPGLNKDTLSFKPALPSGQGCILPILFSPPPPPSFLRCRSSKIFDSPLQTSEAMSALLPDVPRSSSDPGGPVYNPSSSPSFATRAKQGPRWVGGSSGTSTYSGGEMMLCRFVLPPSPLPILSQSKANPHLKLED